MSSRRHPWYAALGVLIVQCVLCGPVPAQHQSGEQIGRQFVVTLIPGQRIHEIAEDYRAVVLGSYRARRLYLLEVQGLDSDDDVGSLFELDPRVEQSEQNSANGTVLGNTQSFFVRVGPEVYQSQPALSLLQLDSAHARATGTGVTVAVLDTGVWPHPLLAANLTADGYNFVDCNAVTDDVAGAVDSNGNGLPDELFGHGTFIAGIVAMVAPQCRIMPVKVLDSDGLGSSFTVAAGIYHAIDHGAQVINLSLSTPGHSLAIEGAVAAADAAGIVVVGAVGNNAASSPSYPAALPGVIGVTATDLTDRRAAFGDFGPFVSLSAPGTDIVSTFPDGMYAMASGTSFAAAFVTGTAALVESLLTAPFVPAAIRAHLMDMSVRIDELNPDYPGMMGQGRVSPSSSVDGCFFEPATAEELP